MLTVALVSVFFEQSHNAWFRPSCPLPSFQWATVSFLDYSRALDPQRIVPSERGDVAAADHSDRRVPHRQRLFPFPLCFGVCLALAFLQIYFLNRNIYVFFCPVNTHDDAHTPSVTNTPSHRHTVIHILSRRTLAWRQALEATLGEIREWCVYKFKLWQNIRFATSHDKYVLESAERRQLLTVVWIILSLRIKQVCFKTQFSICTVLILFCGLFGWHTANPESDQILKFSLAHCFLRPTKLPIRFETLRELYFSVCSKLNGIQIPTPNQTSTWNSSPDSAFFSSTAATESPHLLFYPNFLLQEPACVLFRPRQARRGVLLPSLCLFSASNLRTFFCWFWLIFPLSSFFDFLPLNKVLIILFIFFFWFG